MSLSTSTPHEYSYRVSGHNTMIKLSNGKIAKHATEKELRCYEQMYKKKSPLIKFCASYYGVHDINVDSNSLHRADSKSYLQQDDDLHIDQKGGLVVDPIHDTHTGYLILEDLNKSFRYPCILDIKLGTRTYWDGAPDYKIDRHIRMCKNTTSGSLGLRVCGMRVYRPSTNEWFVEDKVWGKALTTNSFLPAVALFFYDGNEFRKDIIDDLVQKITDLLKIVENSKWRFWSSSILITYEGDKQSKADVHLIDFGNCNFSDDYDDPDDGCILALNNLIACLRLIQNGAVSRAELKSII